MHIWSVGAAKEPVEDVRQVLLWHPWPKILEIKQHACIIRFYCNQDF